MPDVEIPAELRIAIDHELKRVAPKRLAVIAEDISQRYRLGSIPAPRESMLRSTEEIVAYAAFRLPATFAAASAALTEVAARLTGWEPGSLLDIGAGPGTSAWAATRIWPCLEHITLVERDEGMIALAKRLASHSTRDAIGQATWIRGDALAGNGHGWLGKDRRYDLVTVAYVIAEMQDSAIPSLIERLWDLVSGVLVVVEPGTPAGFERIRKVREQGISLGAQVAAPCPHYRACPMPPKDWCHFSKRVARSRLHRQVKSGELGYEDEKFSYVALSRLSTDPIAGRVLRHPWTGKGHIRMQLCEPAGLATKVVTRKDKAAFKQARDIEWGSAIRDWET